MTAPSIHWPSIRLLVAVPTRAHVHGGTMLSILAEVDALRARGAGAVSVVVEPVAPIALARNWIVDDVLRGDWSHVLMRDGDVMVDPDVPARLVELGEHFSACDYLVRRTDAPRFTGDSFTPVDARGVTSVPHVGFGCALLTRSLLERMTTAHPELRSRTHGRTTVGLFDARIVDGEREEEDWAFCHRVRELGEKVHVLADTMTVHVGEALYAASLRKAIERSQPIGKA